MTLENGCTVAELRAALSKFDATAKVPVNTCCCADLNVKPIDGDREVIIENER